MMANDLMINMSSSHILSTLSHGVDPQPPSKLIMADEV